VELQTVASDEITVFDHRNDLTFPGGRVAHVPFAFRVFHGIVDESVFEHGYDYHQARAEHE
jgi:hypothetical protein